MKLLRYFLLLLFATLTAVGIYGLLYTDTHKLTLTFNTFMCALIAYMVYKFD
jgi:hypothetical protein